MTPSGTGTTIGNRSPAVTQDSVQARPVKRVLKPVGRRLAVDLAPPSNPPTWLLGKLLQTDVREDPVMMA